MANFGSILSDVTVTGTGAPVLGTSPTLSTAVLGSSTATTQSPGDSSTKLATTAYVDAAVQGTDAKDACKYGTTAALPTVVYNNGSSGVGATLIAVGLGALSLDGNTPAVNDRVLVKNQVSTFQNGIYNVTTVGNAGVAFVLTRATDFDQAADIDIGDSVFITNGTVNASTTWVQNGTNSPVMGTDPITFAQIAGPGSITSGNGITVTGLSVAIDTSVTVDKTTVQTLTNKTLTSPVLTTPVINGASSGTGVATAATASTLVLRDGSGNLTSNNSIESYTTTATSGGTLTLVVGSTYQQFLTGTQAHTVVLPVASTLVLGQTFLIVNNSTGLVTVQASAGVTAPVIELATNTSVVVTCILTSGTTAASWAAETQTLGMAFEINAGGDSIPVLGISINDPDFEYNAAGDVIPRLQTLVNWGGNMVPTDDNVFGNTGIAILTDSGGFSSTPRLAKLGIGAAADANRLLYVTGNVSGGVATIERTNAATNAVLGTMIVKATTTGGQMTTGFGAALQFAIQDTDAVENIVSSIQVSRTSDADTSANMGFFTQLAGTPVNNMILVNDGSVNLGILNVSPLSSDGAALGTTTLQWSDLFVASGAVLNFANGNVAITHTSGILTIGTGTLKITTPTNTTTSVVTIDGTQTLTNKSIAITQLTGLGTGVATALAINTGSAGAFVVLGGALGTPSSGTGTNISGIPAANILAGSFGAGAYVISTSLQAATIELGAATDTTLARVSAGVISVEGVRVIADSGTTSGTILKNNGTTFVASTETYATPGTSGNVMTSNGTNWTSATPSGITSSTLIISSLFETSARFSSALNGTGTTTFGNSGTGVKTGATGTSSARLVYGIVGNNFATLYASSKSFSIMVDAIDVVSNGSGSAYFGIAFVTVDGTGHTFTGKHIGFKMTKVSSVTVNLFATQADGTTENASSSLTTIANGDTLELILVVNGTSSVDYYWRKNGGALSSATNLTSNFPTGAQGGSLLQFSTSNNSTAVAFDWQAASFSYVR